MKALQPVSLAALCLALSACGGSEGGGGVASTPAPIPASAPAPSPAPSPTPTPTPTPPPVTLTSTDVVRTPLSSASYAGLVAGTNSAIAIAYERGASSVVGAYGLQTVKTLGANALRLTIEPAGKTYTLEYSQPGYPAKEVYALGREPTGFLQLPGTGVSDFGNHVVTTERYSDGTTKTFTRDVTEITQGQQPVDNGKGQFEYSSLYMNLGQRYVSWGVWTHDSYRKTGPSSFDATEAEARNQVYFVSGRRTAAGEIPTTGKATYLASIFGNSTVDSDITLNAPDRLTLVADFASKLIAATIKSPATFYDDDWRYSYWGTDLSGSATLGASGDFQIGLTGTAFLTAEASDNNTAQSKAMSGSILGALFGPGAEEAGGVLQLTLDGSPLFYGSFVGERQAP